MGYWLYFNSYKHGDDAKFNVYRTWTYVIRSWQQEKYIATNRYVELDACKVWQYDNWTHGTSLNLSKQTLI
jgi:hypothetical protein